MGLNTTHCKERVADLAAYREFPGKMRLSLPGAQESTTYTVMEQAEEALSPECRTGAGRR